MTEKIASLRGQLNWSPIANADVDTCVICGQVAAKDEMTQATPEDADDYDCEPGDWVCEDCA